MSNTLENGVQIRRVQRPSIGRTHRISDGVYLLTLWRPGNGTRFTIQYGPKERVSLLTLVINTSTTFGENVEIENDFDE